MHHHRVCAVLGHVQYIVAVPWCWPCAMRSDICATLAPCSASAPPQALLGIVQCTTISVCVVLGPVQCVVRCCGAGLVQCAVTSGHSWHNAVHHLHRIWALCSAWCSTVVLALCNAVTSGHCRHDAVHQYHPMHCWDSCSAPSLHLCAAGLCAVLGSSAVVLALCSAWWQQCSAGPVHCAVTSLCWFW